jgi:hypothetical protein
MVPIKMAMDHNLSMYFLLSPEDFMSLVEANPSGRFDTKIATKNAILIAPPAARVIPRAAFSGILSITDPMNNDRPEADFLSLTTLPSDSFMCSLLEALDFDFLSRIRFATLYETPPRINPVAVAGSVWVTLNASTNIEKVNVAINTPLPKAIIVVTTLCDKLAKRDSIHPISNGLEAIKPKSNDSNMP